MLQRFVGEALFGASEDQKQRAAMAKSVLQLEENVGEMLRGMREMQGQLQQQQLNLTQIITNMVGVVTLITSRRSSPTWWVLSHL